MKLIRYAIQCRDLNYLKSDWDGGLTRVKCSAADNVLDADLYKEKSIAERVIKETLNGSGFLFTTYDDDNPPVKVVKVKFDTKVS